MVKGGECERRDLEPRDLLIRTELIEPERRRRPVAQGHEQPNALVTHPPDHVRNDSHRGRVEPLNVVDRDQDRGRACERPYRSQYRNRNVPRLRGSVRARLATQQCDFEGVLLGGGKDARTVSPTSASRSMTPPQGGRGA